MQITGNTVAVTGGGSGIGLAIARALAGQGNTVVVLGRSQEKLVEACRQAPALQWRTCDVTDEASIRQTFEGLVADFPGLNVVVNAAGMSRACRFAEDDGAIRLARDEIATNLLGTIMVTRIALPTLLQRTAAAVVIVSSGIAYAPHVVANAVVAGIRKDRSEIRISLVKALYVLSRLSPTLAERIVSGSARTK